jgi:predicted RNase H-like HicB family nuclease
MTIPRYVTITYRADDFYIAYHPELSAVFSQGCSPEEARENLIEATQMTIEHLREYSLPIPPVLSMEEMNKIVIDMRRHCV